MSEHNFAIALSIVALLSFVPLLYATQRSRSRESQTSIDAEESAAIAILTELESTSLLIDRLTPIYADALSDSKIIGGRTGGNPQLVPMIRAWAQADRIAKEERPFGEALLDTIGLVERHVRVINDFGALVDAGLVSPRHFFHTRNDWHLRLLRETSLLEPYVWQQTVSSGRGRYGMRIAELALILRRLSIFSTSSELSDEPRLNSLVNGSDKSGSSLLIPPGRKSYLYKVRFSGLFYDASINRRTKLRQKRFTKQLSSQLDVPTQATIKW
jgi:hypothetical protein